MGDTRKLWDIMWHYQYKLKQGNHHEKENRSDVPEELRHDYDMYIISKGLHKFFSDYSMTLPIVHKIVFGAMVLLIFSFIPIVLFIAFLIIKFFYILWLGADNNTRLNSAWALLLLPIGAFLGAFIQKKLGRK